MFTGYIIRGKKLTEEKICPFRADSNSFQLSELFTSGGRLLTMLKVAYHMQRVDLCE